MKTATRTPADIRMILIVHRALRRDLSRLRHALTTEPYPAGGRRLAIGRHVIWMMDFLHNHHRGEDKLWPLVRERNASAGPLLDVMDQDHNRVSSALEDVRAAASRYMKDEGDAARNDLVQVLDVLTDVLLPHLEREEKETLPLISATLSDAELHVWDQQDNIKGKSLRQLAMEGHWVLDGIDPEGYDVVVHLVPPIPRFIILKGFARSYRRRVAALWGGVEAKTYGVRRVGRIEVVVDAPLEAVWRVVSDVTRVGEWSHECRGAVLLAGATAAAPGVRFRGRNKNGATRWTRTNEFLTVEAPRELAWRTLPTLLYPDSTEWRVRLEPAGQGTRIVQTFQVLQLPAFFDWLYSRMLPQHRDRTAGLSEDLRRLGALATQESLARKSAA